MFAGQVLADMATLYVVHARQSRDAATLAAALQTALDAREVIEQAKGVIAEYEAATSMRRWCACAPTPAPVGSPCPGWLAGS